MNVIDTLIVELGLDNSGFKRGTEEAGKAQDNFVDQSRRQSAELDDLGKKSAAAQSERAKELNARAKTAAESFAKIRNQALSLFAVFTAGKGISAFTKSTTQDALSLEKLSENLNISEERLLGYAQAAKNVGGTIAGVYSMLTKASNDAALRRRGEVTQEVRVAYQYGGDIKNEDFSDAETWLMKQADILNSIRLRKGEQEALVVSERMGIARTEFNLLKMGSAALREQIEAGKQVRGLTKEQVKDLAELAKQMNDLAASFEATGKSIAANLAPHLKEFLDTLQGFSEWMRTDDFTDTVGEKVAEVLAFFGNDEAKRALEINKANKPFFDNTPLSKERLDAKDKAKHRHRREDYEGIEVAVKFFESKGWTREQANGIVANLKAESGLKTDAVGDGGKAYGIAQWHPDRQEKFKEHFGYDIRRAGLNAQLEFVHYELMNNEAAAGKKLKAAKTTSAATEVMQVHYERPDPKNRATDTIKRQTIAHQIEARQAPTKAQDAKPAPSKESVPPAPVIDVHVQAAPAQPAQAPQKPIVIQSPVRQAMNARYSTFNKTSNSTVSHVSNETKIGPISINTQSTDPKRIGNEAAAAIERKITAINASSGMSQ